MVFGYFCGFYAVLHLIFHLMFSHCNERYIKMTNTKQSEYRAYAISPIHSTISVTLAWIGMFYVCPSGASVFDDEECMNTPKYFHIWAIGHTSAYFTTDFINTAFVIREFTAYDIQMIGHHLISIATLFGTLVLMNFTTVIAAMLLMVELSTTYICIRWLLYAHRQHRHWCQTVNTVVCFLTFLFTRLIFQIFVLFVYAYPMLGEMFREMGNEWWEIALIVEMALATGVGALMNSYWMYLIIHQFIRMFKRMQRGEDFELETSGPNELMDEDNPKNKDSEEEGDGAVASTDDDQERVPLMNRKRRSERKNRHNSESSDLSAGEKRSV